MPSSEHQRLAETLKRHHVGDAIAERVLRLNPNPRPGEGLRGIHRRMNLRWHTGAMPKGEFIATFGRAAFDALPKHALFKSGKRRWVTREAVRERLWEIWQGKRRADVVCVQLEHGFHGDNLHMRCVPWPEFAKLRGFPDAIAGQ